MFYFPFSSTEKYYLFNTKYKWQPKSWPSIKIIGYMQSMMVREDSPLPESQPSAQIQTFTISFLIYGFVAFFFSGCLPHFGAVIPAPHSSFLTLCSVINNTMVSWSDSSLRDQVQALDICWIMVLVSLSKALYCMSNFPSKIEWVSVAWVEMLAIFIN